MAQVHLPEKQFQTLRRSLRIGHLPLEENRYLFPCDVAHNEICEVFALPTNGSVGILADKPKASLATAPLTRCRALLCLIHNAPLVGAGTSNVRRRFVDPTFRSRNVFAPLDDLPFCLRHEEV